MQLYRKLKYNDTGCLFADIHGKILLPFKLVDLYQKTTSKSIDVILQCGDIGAFPDLATLDKATIRHAKNDRDELGFYDDFTAQGEKKTIKDFLQHLNIHIYCVRGNHEDHEFLDNLEKECIDDAAFSIDIYQYVWVLKTGFVKYFQKEDTQLSVVGVGRIGDRKGRTDAKFIQPYEQKAINKLIKKSEMHDVLITHDKDDMSQRGYGMAEIRKILDNIIVQYHFHGHTGAPYHKELDINRITQTCKIKELEFDSSGALPKGCMIILEKDKEGNFGFEVVSQKITNQITKHNWKYY